MNRGLWEAPAVWWGLFCNKTRIIGYLDMQVLKTISSAQTISVIPRYEPTGTVRYTLRSEDENKQEAQANVAATYTNGYLTFDVSFTSPNQLIEGQFYKLTVEEQDGSNYKLLYRGKIYCTDQTTLPKYTTQENEFTEYTGNDNEYAII